MHDAAMRWRGHGREAIQGGWQHAQGTAGAAPPPPFSLLANYAVEDLDDLARREQAAFATSAKAPSACTAAPTRMADPELPQRL
jgi:hypothetical protein